MNRNIRQIAFPVMAAFIWGMAFVFQRESTSLVGALTFNATRSFVAVGTLLVVIFIFSVVGKKNNKKGESTPKKNPRDLIIGGVCCGIVLAIATNLQQLGMADTSAGKAGFITALYIVIVPVMGLFVNKKATLNIWISVIIAVFGLYFLCVKEGFALKMSDIYVFMCAIAFAVHIMVVDHFSKRVDGVKLSCVQFAVVGIVSAIPAFIFEVPSMAAILQCAKPILYVGIMSSGVAYTLQIISQKDSNPTVVSLLFSLESVFSVIAGAVILGEVMSGRELLGCSLMLTAVVLAQLPMPGKFAVFIRKKMKKTAEENG